MATGAGVVKPCMHNPPKGVFTKSLQNIIHVQACHCRFFSGTTKKQNQQILKEIWNTAKLKPVTECNQVRLYY